MKRILLISFLILIQQLSFGHEGEDHGAKKVAAIPIGKNFSSEALSEKFEVLVKYGELEGGKEGTFQLFLSHAATNDAIDTANLQVKVVGKPGIQFKIVNIDTGVYQVTGTFPANEIYDLQVNIRSPYGSDFLQVPKIEVGKKAAIAQESTADSHWYSSPLLWGTIGILLGVLLMYFLMRRRNRRLIAASLLLVMIFPVSVTNRTMAHGGEDHGGGAAKTGGISTSFTVEKESQFLFNILTEKTGGGSFYQSTELLGTVTASPQGSAVIQAPQTGKIVSLRVTPGQVVAKGQILATVQQQVDAGTQIDIISQRNTLNAEVKAAKAQYDRLRSIADIAAKKDVTEARARYEAAVQNLQLFNANISGGSTKMVALTAPISGVVGTFNYAIGAVVSEGQTLFDITNLNRVFVETQLFATNLKEVSNENRFVAFSSSDTVRYALRMISTAQTVNTENQSQKVIFEVINPAGKFKIGENVRVLQFGSNRIAGLVIPTAAIVDINGKPAVFIKDKAEQFSLSFIQKGESNAIYTAVAKGVEGGEKLVTENVYQMKMMYLGQ